MAGPLLGGIEREEGGQPAGGASPKTEDEEMGQTEFRPRLGCVYQKKTFVLFLGNLYL
jgi:hypothetical protein